MTCPSQRLIYLLFGLILPLLVMISLSVGGSEITLADLGNEKLAGLAKTIIWEVRMPRTILALATGASLGLSGAVLQGLLRNPLADPGVIGVSAVSALGAVIAFYFGFASVAVGGIVGGLAAAFILIILAGRNTSNMALLLAGVAMASFAVALTSLALNLAPSPLAAYEIMFWLLGAVADRAWDHMFLSLPLVMMGCAMLFACGNGLKALTLGEDVAHSLGISLVRLRWLAVLGTALAVGASVAVTGAIGFVGLVVPHLMRPLVGHDPKRLLLASTLGGAIMLLTADLAVRLLPLMPELKLGVATALVGAPFFLWLILKMRAAR